MLTISSELSTLLPYKSPKPFGKDYMVKPMKAKIGSPIEAYCEFIKSWSPEELNSRLLYKAFILDSNKETIMAYSTRNVFELEDNPRAFFRKIANLLNDNVDKPEIIFTRSMLGKSLVYDEKISEFAINLQTIAQQYDFYLNDYMIVQSDGFLSLRMDNVLH